MIGAIIGDIVGSRFEFHPNKNWKGEDFFSSECEITDDTIMTLAVANVFLHEYFSNEKLLTEDGKTSLILSMKKFAKAHPYNGYGNCFSLWLKSKNPQPYNSFGNGAAMRISPAGWFGKSLKEVLALAKVITEVSHNHPEAIKGAQCVAHLIYVSRQMKERGKPVKSPLKKIAEEYYPEIANMNYEDVKKTYSFDETCQNTVPQAIMCFLESTDFKDAIIKAVSLGGDADTLGAITGSIAECFYDVEQWIIDKAITYIPDKLLPTFNDFRRKFLVPKIEGKSVFPGLIIKCSANGEGVPIDANEHEVVLWFNKTKKEERYRINTKEFNDLKVVEKYKPVTKLYSFGFSMDYKITLWPGMVIYSKEYGYGRVLKCFKDFDRPRRWVRVEFNNNKIIDYFEPICYFDDQIRVKSIFCDSIRFEKCVPFSLEDF